MEFEPRIGPIYIGGGLALDLTGFRERLQKQFREKFRITFRKLWCSNRVRNKVPEKVWMGILKKNPEKIPGCFGIEQDQV
jgi:hypothetical protein